jgi:ankyrin repeat protein
VKGKYNAGAAMYDQTFEHVNLMFDGREQAASPDERGAAEIRKELRKGANINQLDEDGHAYTNTFGGDGFSALMYASSLGLSKSVQALLEASEDWIDVNAQQGPGDSYKSALTGSTEGATALTMAAYGGHVEVVRLLLNEVEINLDLEVIFSIPDFERLLFLFICKYTNN